MSKFQTIVFTNDPEFVKYLSEVIFLRVIIMIVQIAKNEDDFKKLLDENSEIDLVIADCRKHIIDTETTMSKFSENFRTSSITIDYDSHTRKSIVRELHEVNMPSDKQVSFNDIVTTIKKFFEDK